MGVNVARDVWTLSFAAKHKWTNFIANVEQTADRLPSKLAAAEGTGKHLKHTQNNDIREKLRTGKSSKERITTKKEKKSGVVG